MAHSVVGAVKKFRGNAIVVPELRWFSLYFLLLGMVISGSGTALGQLGPRSTNACRDRESGPVIVTPQISHRISDFVVASNEDVAVSRDQAGTLKIWGLEARPNVGPLLRTIPTGANVWDLAMSADGRRVATAHDGAICVWDLDTGRPALALLDSEREMKRVRSVVFANQGRWLVSAGDDGLVRIWNASSGSLERVLHKQDQPINKLSLGSDGRLIAAGTEDGWLRLWALPEGTPVWSTRTSPEPIQAIAISEKSGIIASGGGAIHVKKGKDTRIRLWNLSDGQRRDVLPPTMPRIDREGGHVSRLSFSPDGKQLYIADSLGFSAWSTDDRRYIRRQPLVRAFAFSPDSRKFLFVEDHDIIQLSQDPQKSIRKLTAGAEASYRVQLSPDGKRLVTLSTGTICLWDLAKGHRVACQSLDYGRTHGAMGEICFTPDGNQVVLHIEAGEVELLDGYSLSSIWRHPYIRSGDIYYPTSELRVSSDGGRIVVAGSDNTIRLFNTLNGTELNTIEADPLRLVGIWISPDGTYAKRLLENERLSGNYASVSLSLLDLSSGTTVSTVQLRTTGSVFSASFSPTSGDFLTLEFSDSGPGHLIFRDGTSGEPRKILDRVAAGVSAFGWTSDGRYLAAAEGSLGYAIKVWNLTASGAPIVLKGHDSDIGSLSFSSDGNRLVSTADDGTKVWSIPRRALAASLYTSPGDDWVTMTPAGFFAGGRRSENLISVVHGLDSFSVQHFFETLYRPDLVEEELNEDPDAKHAIAAASLSLTKILLSGTAPRLEFLERDTEKLDSAVRVKVRVKDEGGGIGSRVVWRVNGQTRAVTEISASGEGTDAAVVEQVLKIVPRTVHTVEVTAYNREGVLASVPLVFPVTSEGAARLETRMHVLAIGITDYQRKDWRLNLAASDAKAFSETIKVAGRGLFSQVKTKLVLDHDASAHGIGAAFDEISRDPDVRPNDVFVLFVAGHGRYDGARYFLVPQDLDTEAPPKGRGHTIAADAISQDTLQRWIASVQVDKRLVILDTCESAQGGGALIRALTDRRLPAMEQLQYATGDNLIAAAGQAAFEANKLGHGLLTYAVLEAFTRPQGSREEEKVTTDTVASLAMERVPILSREIFGQEQWPVRKMSTGVPIPLGFRRLAEPPVSIPPPIRINFILMRQEVVRTEPKEAALTEPVITLAPPMIVQILGYDDTGAWVRIQWGGALGGAGVGVGWVPTAAVQEPKSGPVLQ